MPDCWMSSGVFSVGGVRNASGDANSGSKYIFGYTLFNAGGYAYIISPKLSTTNEGYVAQFSLKGSGQSGASVNFEYGTLADNNNVSGFVPFGEVQTTTANYTKYTTPLVTNGSHNYFALRFQISEQHTSVYLDDFKWKEASSLSVNLFKDSSIKFSVYPNPSRNKYVTIDVNNNMKNDLRLRVYNLIGEKILMQQIDKSKHKINVSSFPKGIYIFELSSKTIKGFKKVFIK